MSKKTATTKPTGKTIKPAKDASANDKARADALAKLNAKPAATAKDASETPTTPRAAKSNKATRYATAAKGSPKAKRGGRGAKSVTTSKDAKAKASTPKPTKPKRLSALDAAAKVLADSDRPLRAIDMIEVMHAEGLWTSPGGKTPAATLYAAITREIAAKGSASRFAKADTSVDGSRGRFVAMASTARRARA